MFKRPSKPLSPLAHFALACGLVLILFVAAMLAACSQPDPYVTTIKLDGIDQRRAYHCMNQGFAIQVWTDGINTRVKCAAPY